MAESHEERDIEAGRTAPPPSSAAVMPVFKEQQQKKPVLNGRPHQNFGLPVGLFHPVFNAFQATMQNPERFYPMTNVYSEIRALFTSFADIYDREENRTADIDKHLTNLLECRFVNTEAKGVKSDGVVSESCGPHIGYPAIREIKNEIGTAGADPYNQGSLAYRKYWVAASRMSSISRMPFLCSLVPIRGYHQKLLLLP